MRENVLSAFQTAAEGGTWRSEVQLKLPAGERIFDMALRPVFGEGRTITAIL